MAFPGTRPALGQKKVVTQQDIMGIIKTHTKSENPLVKALTSNLDVNETKTENGMPTYKSTLNSATDFFFMAAALRKGGRVKDVSLMFSKVWQEDRLVAIKLLFWLRDIRGGAGEKLAFQLILGDLFLSYPPIFNHVIQYVPEYGSFKDLIPYIEKSNEVVLLFGRALLAGNGLAAKWLGRPAGKHLKQAKIVANSLGMNLKDYRHLLVELTNVVEQQMCANRWEDIKYESVPSQAMHIYRTAFFKHDGTRFQQLIDSANKGEVVLRAGAIFPGDLVAGLKLQQTRGGFGTQLYNYYSSVNGVEKDAIDAQWLGLPNYFGDTQSSILPVIDVSGSMGMSSSGTNLLNHAIALGIYVAEHQQGVFQNALMTFSNTSKFYLLQGKTLSQKVEEIKEDNMSTNLASVFHKLLSVAAANSIKQEDMPKSLLIISDMEFNQVGNSNQNAMQAMTDLYTQYGYTIPQVIFWNMASRHDNAPVRANQGGVQLISGYSPAIMKSVLSSKPMATPTELMLEVVNSDRYSRITLE
jgi:hypothetical protein